MDDTSFRKILHFMNLSWAGYRRVRKGVKRRLSRRMLEVGVSTVEDYIQLLRADPSERKEAERLLTVSISRFFRDRGMWDALERLIPHLDWKHKDTCTAWCAGCAGGEEVYSLTILWEELKPAADLPPLHVFATDSNDTILERAMKGVYSRSSLKEMREPLIHRYFRRVDGELAILRELTLGIHWMAHDFTTDPPPCSRCHLIFIRNSLLTYYDPSLVTPVLTKLTEVLEDGGLLIVGNNEQLPVTDLPLKRTEAYRAIIRKGC